MKLSDLRKLVETNRTTVATVPEWKLHRFPSKGPRGHALERFRDFVAALVFQRETEGEKSQAFKVPLDRIFIHFPDPSQENPQIPGVAIQPGPYTTDTVWTYALGQSEPDEATIDKYGQGTVVLPMAYYSETVTVEVVSSVYPITRGIVEGLRYASRLFAPSAGAVYLQCPGYFDQLASFRLADGDGYIADLMNEATGRRIAHLRFDLVVPEVALIDYRRMRVLLDFGPGGTYIRDGAVYPTLD
jgi:hypothetical protein